MHRLMRNLGCGKAQAVGHLHMLWEWASSSAARAGDVGRYDDQVIEEKCAWPGESGRLVRALLEERWLDQHPDPEVRLVIHDWADHCEDSVHRALARACLRFADGRIPKLGGLNAEEKARAQEAYRPVDSPMDSPMDSPYGQSSGGRLTVSRPPAVAVAVAVPLPTETPPTPPADGGVRLARLVRARDDLTDYWRQLGGRPDRKDRRLVWEALQKGYTTEQLRGSISERVREDLVKAGKLDPSADWPPDVEVAQPP